MERRLAAILAADVVGYSRLMRSDEAGTLAALKSCESGLIEPVVARNNGRIVKRMGDGFLVEFGSAVDAVECALAWQGISNAAEGTPIRFRIGVNLGDIIFQDDDIYGDGVNVAARLEGLADAGGICIASVVHDQVRRKVEATFTDLGDQALKNIDEPVRVFSWSRDDGAAESAEKITAPTETEPSMLLVVPFRALGADPTAETLSEALTENISVAMSHFDEMSILDPGAVPADADVKSGRELGQRLGVLFLLEGRVQAAGDKVRVSAQIVEVETGQRKWSDSFDREVGDVFALQDDLTAIVASTVGEALISLVSEALDRKPESAWTARDFVMRGTTHLHRVDREQTLLAREYFEKALAREPQSPLAIICDCWTYAFEVMFGWPRSRDDGVDYAIARIRELLTRSERHSQAHRLMGRLLHIKDEHSAALNYTERAFELNPYDSDMLIAHGHSLLCTGQGARAVELAERAVRINPYAPEFYGLTLAQAYLLVGRLEDALSVLNKLSRPVGASQHARVMCLAMLDRLDEARAGFEAIAAERPGLSVEIFRKTLPFEDGPEVDEILTALKRAGVPGKAGGQHGVDGQRKAGIEDIAT